ncbi:MAG: ATP-binding protein, partial [Polyangiaceae bacterium]
RNATVKGALDGIVTMDHRGAIVEMNDAAQKLFGYTVEEVRGRPLADVIIPERLREDHRRGLARYVETGQSGVLNERLDLTAMRSDGSEFPAEVSIVELEGLVPPLFAGFVRDQTALRAARADLQRTIESLERSNADLERFAYLASHDLQEPLRMVSAYLQLLQQQAGGALDDQALAFLDYAKEGAARMRTLIDGLLALARVDSRGARFDWVALDDVVRTALATLRMLAADTQARIDVSPLPKVWGDEAQLASVFENLVGNALIHGGDAPPRIEIGARREGGDWVLAVRDHGVGFEPRQNERIFEIFHAIERDTNTESRQSTGVGLAIVRRIVQRHGGAIWAEGRPGEGATFTFTLRAAPPDGSSSSEHDRGDE